MQDYGHSDPGRRRRSQATITDDSMNDKTKIALIIAVAAIICVGMWIYFSPYHSCMRESDNAALCIGSVRITF